ncbi:MAG: hypothetical protein KAV45_02655 [Calditrichia bacterium]|nr:hypothetical protein [Calditrichia bacterium]
MMEAIIYDFMGKPDLASAGYQDALVLLQTEVEKWPEDPRYHSALGIVYASLGHEKEALREGRKAVELFCPYPKMRPTACLLQRILL